MNLYDHSHFAIAVKLDSSGKKIWEYKGMEHSRFQSISLKSDGRCVATGNNMDEDFGMNILVVQLNKNGKEEWSRSFGNNTLWEYASSIAATSDGGSIIAGQTESSGAGRYDWWMLSSAPWHSLLVVVFVQEAPCSFGRSFVLLYKTMV